MMKKHLTMLIAAACSLPALSQGPTVLVATPPVTPASASATATAPTTAVAPTNNLGSTLPPGVAVPGTRLPQTDGAKFPTSPAQPMQNPPPHTHAPGTTIQLGVAHFHPPAKPGERQLPPHIHQPGTPPEKGVHYVPPPYMQIYGPYPTGGATPAATPAIAPPTSMRATSPATPSSGAR